MAKGSPLQTYLASHPGIAVAAATMTPQGVEREFHNCDSETRFEIGSITKVFSGILLCEAVQDGHCGFDTKLSEILPEHVPKLLGRKITLRHLATHTSSLPRLPIAMPGAWAGPQPYAAWDREKVLHALSATPITRTPGTLYAYSNFGFAVLGLALETLRGQSYAEMVASLSRRLGCPEVRLRAESDKLAEGRNAKGHQTPPWDMAAFASAGALTANLEGLVKFAQRSLTPLNAPALADSMTERTKVEKRTNDPRAIAVAYLTSGVGVALAASAPDSIAMLLALGIAAYLGGPGFGLIPVIAWTAASAKTGAPINLVGERLGLGLVGTGIAQSLRKKTKTQEMGIGWHLSKAADERELLWHNGGTGGYRSFLGIVPATGKASIVLAASADSVDSVGLGLLAG